MKKTLLLLSFVIGVTYLSVAQPWTNSLPKNNGNQLTLKDYQKSFYEYWKPFNLNRGYYIDANGKKQKARGWKQFKRWEYYWETQVDSKTGYFPEQTAYQVLKDFKKEKNLFNAKNLGNWISLGTSSSDGGYAGIGRINCIAFHPTDNSTYWVGTPAGGLWVTHNNGNTWKVLTDENSVLGVSDIVIPSDYETSHIIYIGTGDRDAWDNRSIGVLKSNDNGATWETTGLAFTVGQGEMVNRLLLDPNDDNTIIAATSQGVYKTVNGGTTWNDKLSDISFIDMEYKIGDFNTLYGATQLGSVNVSNDGGETWDSPISAPNRIELAVTPANNSIVYALAASSNNGLYAVYRSVNSGESFTKVFTGNDKNLLGWKADGTGSGGQGFYDLSLAVSPTNENIVVVGGVNSWRSTDGGDDFTCINHWWGNGVPAVHADKHMLKYRKNGDLFECNDGGVYLSTNDGTAWQDKTNGIVNSQMYKLSVSQQINNEVVTGLQDNGSKLYTQNGWSDVNGGDGMECLIDYADNNVQYASGYSGYIVRTTDHWSNSTSIQPDGAGYGAWVTPYIIDPVDHNTLYAGYSDVWKTTNKGNSWTKISSLNVSKKIRAMAIASSNNNTLYISGGSTLYKTENGGTDWENISSGLPGNFITYIAVKNNDPNTLWVSLGEFDNNSVYESTDGGATWNNISEGLPEIPANSIVQDNNYNDKVLLYVGTEAGVFFKDGDNLWVFYSNGMPSAKIGELEIYYNNDISKCKLRAATYGRGLWETPLVIPNVPTVNSIFVDTVLNTSAYAGAKIESAGGFNVIESGFIYGKSSNVEMGNYGVKKATTSPAANVGEYGLKITGLDASSYYFIKAYAVTEAGTGYSSEISFATNCDGSISFLPFAQEFNSDTLPSCWSNIDNLGNDMAWQFNNEGSVEFTSTTSANGFALINSEYYGDGKTQDADLITPVFDFSNTDTVNLSFEHYFKFAAGAKAGLLYSSDNGATWAAIQEWGESTGNSNAAEFFVKDVSAQVAGKPQVQFKWKFTGSNSGFWCIDDVYVDSLFTVLFSVTDDGDQPVSNAIVELGNAELTTNFAGESFFKTVSSTLLDYKVTTEGFANVEGNVSVSTNEKIDVKFSISTDATLSDLKIDDTTVDGFDANIFDYTVMLPSGTTEMPVVSATANQADATVNITQATQTSLVAKIKVTAEDNSTILNYYVYFTIEAEPTYKVTFNVTDAESETISDASVSFMNIVRTTNDNGVALFNGIPAVNNESYVITKSSYENYEGAVSVVDQDVSVDVILIMVGIADNNELTVTLFPNPTKRMLHLSIANNIPQVNFTLVDINGKIVMEKVITNNKEVIDLKGNPKGIYFVNLTVNNKNYTKKIVLE